MPPDAPVERTTYIAVDDADAAADAGPAGGLCSRVFGWEFDDVGFVTMIRRPAPAPPTPSAG